MNTILGFFRQKKEFDPIIEQYASILRILTNKRDNVKEEIVSPAIRYHIDILLEHIDKEIIRYHQQVLDVSQQKILVWGIYKDINKTKELLSPYEWVSCFFWNASAFLFFFFEIFLTQEIIIIWYARYRETEENRMIYRDIPGGMGGIYEEVLRGTQPLLPIIAPRNLHDLIFQNRVIEGNRGNTEEFLHMIAIAHASLREFEVLVACEAESIDMEIALLQSVMALDRAYQCIHHSVRKAVWVTMLSLHRKTPYLRGFYYTHPMYI